MCGYSTSVASENENGLDSGISIDPDEFRTADEIQYDKTVEREWKVRIYGLLYSCIL
tara:strand:+ start:937 stop:1107 length:171 start_codon:yes stop_codon:yes gene_type:complete